MCIYPFLCSVGEIRKLNHNISVSLRWYVKHTTLSKFQKQHLCMHLKKNWIQAKQSNISPNRSFAGT